MSISTPSIIIIAISVVNFVPDAIGLIFNLFVFTRSTLRREPCAIYFLSATCFNVFIIFIVLPVRILSNGSGITLENSNRGICKFTNFSFNGTRSISCWLIALACVDRYLHSSTNIHIRRFSSVKAARVVIGITVMGIYAAYSHMLIYLDLRYSTDRYGNIVSQCSSPGTSYDNFNSFFHMTFYSLCPSFLMLLFGFLTISNVRQRRQVLPIANKNSPVVRRTNHQLLRMLAAQVLVIIISTLPFSIMRLYSIFTANVPKDSLRRTQETLAPSVIVTIPYFAHASSFSKLLLIVSHTIDNFIVQLMLQLILYQICKLITTITILRLMWTFRVLK